MATQFYLWMHLAGIGLALLAIGGLAQQREDWRKTLTIAHGIGMLLLLVSGFGLLARLVIPWPWPGWVFGKIALWIVLGGTVSLFKRLPHLSMPLWWGVWGVFLVAAYLVIAKPF